jgi:hypothetical protein
MVGRITFCFRSSQFLLVGVLKVAASFNATSAFGRVVFQLNNLKGLNLVLIQSYGHVIKHVPSVSPNKAKL